MIAEHNFIIGRSTIVRYYWLLLAILMLATFANAQGPECTDSDCRRGNTIECNPLYDTWGAGAAPAQEAANIPAASSNAAVKPWAFSLTTAGYIVPRGESYVSPDFTADRGALHLEARYNNEAVETGSLWAGYNLKTGEKLVLNVTPMIGSVFGKLNGLAPGYLFTLTYKRVLLYSNGEFVFDVQNRGRGFFYNWDEITYSPLKWLQVGFVSQRTRAYHTSLNIQRGVLVGFTYKKVNFTTNVFNFGWTTPTEVLSLGFNF